MSIDTDVASILAGWDSQSVVLNDVTCRGLLDEMDVLDVDHNREPVLVTRTVLKVQRSLFVDALGVVQVARGDIATIGGVTYTVADVRVGGADGRASGLELDGRELHLSVRKV